MKNIISYVLIAACILWAGYANAAASYPLPDPGIQVNPNYGGNTTIVTIAGVTYRGASHFYYLHECDKPDSARYHCSVMGESWVVLTALDHSTVTVNIIAQFASVLITSGHNYWRQSQLVLSGDVYVP